MNPKEASSRTEPPDDVRWHLQRCDGFLDIKMIQKAREELDALPADWKSHESVKAARLRLAMEEEKWAEATALSRELRKSTPKKPDYWILLAYATRRARNLEAARAILLEARGRFPREATIHFNLACYECQLENPDAAMQHLKTAVQLNPKYREMAAEDEDLEPLWPLLESLAPEPKSDS